VTELDVERGRAHPREVAPTRRTRHLIPHHSQQGPLPTSSLIASKLNSVRPPWAISAESRHARYCCQRDPVIAASLKDVLRERADHNHDK